MSDDGEMECPPCPQGMPGWVMTFADLMSLLMCFFVLLLSFSEMDVLKYKQVAGSMREAFGVQNVIKNKDIPKGTSIIAQEFSPGKPDPTPLNEVRQNTTDITKSTLDVKCNSTESMGSDKSDFDKDKGKSDADSAIENNQIFVVGELANLEKEKAEDEEETKKKAEEVASTLSDEVNAGQVEVVTRHNKIIIRVREYGSFQSGSAQMNRGFLPTVDKIKMILAKTPGAVFIEGHTDDRPIATAKFPSNWYLSSARALSVGNRLFEDGMLDQRRFKITGFSDTRPLGDNESLENRRRNRRVEIVISQAERDVSKNIDNQLREIVKPKFKTDKLDYQLTPGELF